MLLCEWPPSRKCSHTRSPTRKPSFVSPLVLQIGLLLKKKILKSYNSFLISQKTTLVGQKGRPGLVQEKALTAHRMAVAAFEAAEPSWPSPRVLFFSLKGPVTFPRNKTFMDFILSCLTRPFESPRPTLP